MRAAGNRHRTKQNIVRRYKGIIINWLSNIDYRGDEA